MVPRSSPQSTTITPLPRKRCLVWDWTNTRDRPDTINQLFAPISAPSSVSRSAADASAPAEAASAVSAVQLFSSCHNWNAWIPPELQTRLPFRPMIRSTAQLEGTEWAIVLTNCDVQPEAQRVVHFLNEPERAGVTPQAAAKAWCEQVVPQLRVQRRVRLVGPACASDEPGTQWLADFMALLRKAEAEQAVAAKQGKADAVPSGLLPDYLGLHYYGADPADAKRYLTAMHKTYDLPVFIPEIASISRDITEVERFTDELTEWMDDTDWVVEYGWFGCMADVADDFVSPAAQLMDKEGNFTPLMKRLMRPRGTH